MSTTIDPRRAGMAEPSYQPALRIPEVFLIGAAKSATSSLAEWLSRHPRIGLAKGKEPSFFSHEERFARGLSWYSDRFDHVTLEQLALDASTGYTQYPLYPKAPERLYRHAPHAKLIYLMRDPVDRAYSHYVHRWSKECHPGQPFTVPFETYVQQDPVCLEASDYRLQLTRYLEHYPSKSLLCLFTHRIKADRAAEMRRVYRFLDVEDDEETLRPQTGRKNRSGDYLESRVRILITDRIKKIPLVRHALPMVPSGVRERLYQTVRKTGFGARAGGQFTPPPMRPETRSKLLERWSESIQWVSDFTGEDLTCWIDPSVRASHSPR